METVINRYKTSKIYKIWTTLGDDVYYGSTCNTLEKRFSEHKLAYKYWKMVENVLV